MAGFLPGIFSRTPAAPAPAPAVPTNSNGSAGPVTAQMNAPANPGAHPANMPGTPGAAPAGGPQPPVASPLDAFTTMFQKPKVDPNTPKAPTLADPLLNPLDPVKFKEQVSQANFAASIPQETIAKAMGGDAQAFADAINAAAREAFSAAAQLSHGLAEQSARTGVERLDGMLDSRIRNASIRSQNTSNEALTHPAVAPMLNAVKMQIAQSNPQLTPEQVQQQAETYFTQMADVLVKPKQEAAAAEVAKNAPKETNFASYLFDTPQK